MKIIANIAPLIFFLLCLCANAMEPEKPAQRYSLLGSSGVEDDAQAVALLDEVLWKIIILASKGNGEPPLREVARTKYYPAVINVSTILVSDKRVFVVISFSGEPIGNQTAFVEIYDSTTGVRVFSGYSRSPATVRDVMGDEQKELILYLDEQDFQHPEAPYLPLVYSFNGETFMPANILLDSRLRKFKSEVKKQFIAFRERLEAECRRFGDCSDFRSKEIAKASRQIDAFDVTDRY